MRIEEITKLTDPDHLAEIATDGHWDEICAVALNERTPPDTLSELGRSKDRRVRYAVAHNPNTPRETLLRLGEDREWDVRREVARNPNAPVYGADEEVPEWGRTSQWRDMVGLVAGKCGEIYNSSPQKISTRRNRNNLEGLLACLCKWRLR